MSATVISLIVIMVFLSGWLVGFARGWNRSYDVHCTEQVRVSRIARIALNCLDVLAVAAFLVSLYYITSQCIIYVDAGTFGFVFFTPEGEGS